MSKPIPTFTAPKLASARVNWLGVQTLYWREVWRFLKVWNQTLLSPVITTLIWLAILMLALGGRRGGGVEHLPFEQFVAPGLIMMSVVQNAFANTSSSLILSKIQGVIVDVLMPPFTAHEITFAMVMGGVTRGLVVACSVALSVTFFVHLPLPHPLLALFYILASSLMLALMGMVAGVWAQGFDQLHAITNYMITPLSFLSGTFYSVHILPGMWQHFCFFNPFFYMIDGFRYAVTGYHDGSIQVGITVLLVMDALLWCVVYRMVKSGWRLKS